MTRRLLLGFTPIFRKGTGDRYPSKVAEGKTTSCADSAKYWRTAHVAKAASQRYSPSENGFEVHIGRVIKVEGKRRIKELLVSDADRADGWVWMRVSDGPSHRRYFTGTMLGHTHLNGARVFRSPETEKALSRSFVPAPVRVTKDEHTVVIEEVV